MKTAEVIKQLKQALALIQMRKTEAAEQALKDLITRLEARRHK